MATTVLGDVGGAERNAERLEQRPPPCSMADSPGPILVTGSHRSGTTWVGRMLAASPGVLYVHEPFNVDAPRPPGICAVRFPYWFTYITQENERRFYKPLRRMLAHRYGPLSAMRRLRSLRGFKEITEEWATCRRARRLRLRPLLKDPIAVFSAGWLAERLGMEVLVMIRHPAAFVSSLKNINDRRGPSHFRFDFSNLLRQPLLMRDRLHPFEREMRSFVQEERGIVDQGILLWKVIYSVVAAYRRQYKGWLFLRHEDVSRRPRDYFAATFRRLGLEYSAEVIRLVDLHSSASNPSEPDDVSSIARHSREGIWNWKRRLTPDEIERIRAGVEEIACEFYSDADWNGPA